MASPEAVGQLSSLGATNSSLRVLKHVGGSVPDILGCIKYVKSCHDDASGGFAPLPGGKPDVVTTALGLMAASELKIADPAMVKAAAEYFGKHAKSFEEVRMAIAGLEAVHGTSADSPKWNEMLQGMRNPDGTWGDGPAQPYATGGAARGGFANGAQARQTRCSDRRTQGRPRPEGGWSKDAGPPDLGATYRIMRALHASRKARYSAIASVRRRLPAVQRQLREQARRRGEPGRHLHGDDRDLLGAASPRHPGRGRDRRFLPLVSGKELTGWEGDTKLWSNKNGVLIGHSPGLDHNEFLSTTATYGDFVLSLTSG